ncbi:hypothetical protein K7X08_012632 [Anisodus acutangulus]|uniref:Tonoplast intrinsic protein n=1 Tax=Anisodus acutangulus TaxID=402998 RepID=A0A9Q1MAE8_9SOLA|nr:hypothetical protein K7X08_012632 [Anisodus acutangulus]
MPGGGLISAALSHAFSLFVAVSVSLNISGGHVNPAVTFAAFIGGHITFYRSVLYWIAQLIGSVVALLLLKFATGGLDTSAYAHRGGATPWNAVIFEIMMTFSLVYTVYATTIDPKKGNTEVIAPIAIGFIVGANTLTAGGLYGAVMNPAMAFGQAVDSWKWESHWIYWLGPFVGAAIAALVYETIFLDSQNTYEQLPSKDTSAYALRGGATPWNAVIFEIMMTFSLVYTVYATTIDPKKGNTEVIAPIAIGFIVGANTLTAGGLYGAVMNPAMAFGQAVDSWKWESHWIYWLGPFVGAAIAALVYETIFLDSQNTYEQLPSKDTSAYALRGGATPWNAVIFEIMMTFSLVYTVYATTIDPKKGNTEVIAPIAIGFIVGANTLTAGGLYGAVMNPAMAFGQAVDSWKWESHWIYWLGPFVGAAIAALVYETIFLDSQNTYEQLPSKTKDF